MKIQSSLLIVALGALVSGCSSTQENITQTNPIIKNTVFESNLDKDMLHVLCKGKRPVRWVQNYSFEPGEQSVIVKIENYARLSMTEVPLQKEVRSTYAQLSVDLVDGQNYIINRKRVNSDDPSNITVWIQNEETGQIVSNKTKVTLVKPKLLEQEYEARACRAS